MWYENMRHQKINVFILMQWTGREGSTVLSFCSISTINRMILSAINDKFDKW